MSAKYISMDPEKEINKIGFGFLRLPQVEDKEDKKICDWEKINKLVDRYFELGGKYIDTAYTYLDGQSEMAVKKCVVERKPRDSFFLSVFILRTQLAEPIGESPAGQDQPSEGEGA